MSIRKRIPALLITAALTAAFVTAATPAQASFHFIKVVQVFIGGQNDNSQYVMLQMYSAGQDQLQGQEITVYGPGGNQSDTFPFPSPDNVNTGTNQSTILAATAQAQNLFQVTADLTIDPSMSATGGKACFGGSGDCVAWGNYSGSSAGVGTPVDPDGFNTRHAIKRDLQGNGTLGLDDDTNDSAADFDVGQATPVKNGGSAGVMDNCFFLSDTAIGVTEATGTMNLLIEGGTGTAQIDYAPTGITATAENDFDDPGTGTVTSDDGTPDTNAVIPIDILNDDDLEGNETFEVQISNARFGVTSLDMCFNDTATVTIVDDEVPPDETDPVSTITKPEHNKTYAKSNLIRFRGTAVDQGDGATGINSVAIKLRKNMKNGTCKFWNGGEFAAGLPCNTHFYIAAEGTNNWKYDLSKALSPSVNTKTKNYTLFAQAVDNNLNDETFEAGRNKNTFEIKPDPS
jgi:Calx-beta domain